MKQISQREFLEKAMKLSQNHPDAEIHILAHSDEILEDYAWTGHKISRVELGYWYDYGGMIYTDAFDLSEELSENQGNECTEEDAIQIMEEAILIYTRAG